MRLGVFAVILLTMNQSPVFSRAFCDFPPVAIWVDEQEAFLSPRMLFGWSGIRIAELLFQLNTSLLSSIDILHGETNTAMVSWGFIREMLGRSSRGKKKGKAKAGGEHELCKSFVFKVGF